MESLGQKTERKLMTYIHDQQLMPGDRLPGEIQLAKILQVGRSTLREVIRVLSAKNILEVKRGAGTFLLSTDMYGEDPLGFSAVKDRIQLTKNLIDIRYLLEPSMASLAAKHASTTEIATLQKLHEEIIRLISEGDESYLLLDKEFHLTIAAASKNVALLRLIPVINNSIDLYGEFTAKREINNTGSHHQDILTAIIEKDSQGAYDAMLIHMAHNRERLTRYLVSLEMDVLKEEQHD